MIRLIGSYFLAVFHRPDNYSKCNAASNTWTDEKEDAYALSARTLDICCTLIYLLIVKER